jgi:hypothetical protein
LGLAAAMAALGLAALVVGAARTFRVAAAPTSNAEVTVDSAPAGARIVFDGHEVGTTPATIPVARPRADEPHRLELHLAGYRDWTTRDVVLKPGDHAFFHAAIEAPSTRLRVMTDPPGAEVAVDGRTVGRTPLGNVTLAADGKRHTLRLRRHDYLDVIEDITLADGVDVVADRKLAPAPRFGTIDLHVDPWAVVYLEGRKVGEAPVKGLVLPVGHHRLKLVNPVRHKELTLAVDVPAKRPYRVTLP